MELDGDTTSFPKDHDDSRNFHDLFISVTIYLSLFTMAEYLFKGTIFILSMVFTGGKENLSPFSGSLEIEIKHCDQTNMIIVYIEAVVLSWV